MDNPIHNVGQKEHKMTLNQAAKWLHTLDRNGLKMLERVMQARKAKRRESLITRNCILV